MPTRLRKHEQKRAIRQTMLFIGASLLLLGFFFFILLPFSVRLFDSIVQKNSDSGQDDIIPPQTPVVYPLPDATNSATLHVYGFGEANSTMELFQGSTMLQTMVAGDDGAFTFENVQLQPAENYLYVVSRDEADNSSESPQHLVVLDQDAPELSISEPTDGRVFSGRKEAVVTVKGTTESSSRVTLNGRLLFLDKAGNFSGTQQLQEGNNELLVRSTDQAGNITESKVQVTYNP